MSNVENKERIKLKIKKGDKVLVIAGSNRGKEGEVLSVDPIENRAVVKGVNLVTKHKKPNAQNAQTGEIIKKEAPVHISNLKVLDPKSGKPTRIGRKPDANGKLKRYAKINGEFID